MDKENHQPTLFPTELNQGEEDGLLTVAQVAKRGQVSVATVRAWISEGRLRALRTSGAPGGHFRVRRSELMRFFAELERGE